MVFVKQTVEQQKAKRKIYNEQYYDAHVAVRKIYDAHRYKKKQALKLGMTLSDFCSPYNIQMETKSDDTFCPNFPKTGKKKKMTLLQRKNKKIESELAKLDAKADAFRTKLAEGLVVDIAEHNFS